MGSKEYNFQITPPLLSDDEQPCPKQTEFKGFHCTVGASCMRRSWRDLKMVSRQWTPSGIVERDFQTCFLPLRAEKNCKHFPAAPLKFFFFLILALLEDKSVFSLRPSSQGNNVKGCCSRTALLKTTWLLEDFSRGVGEADQFVPRLSNHSVMAQDVLHDLL